LFALYLWSAEACFRLVSRQLAAGTAASVVHSKKWLGLGIAAVIFTDNPNC
jgi:hypothetical protein